MNKVTIALDAMGGDYGPAVTVPAALRMLRLHERLHIILVGDQHILQQHTQHANISEERLHIQHASEVVGMDELPSFVLRNKKDSSMRVAVDLVKQEVAQACVSAGNTGALMATARFVLKTLPGVDRPAIISELPTTGEKTRLLDLGANVDSCAEHLFQFAVMGAVLVSAVDEKHNPSVGLLNIGVEEIKGNDQVKRTAQLLSENSSINYIGYVEGDDIFKGSVDVVVCDGFVGNVALKTSEGAAKLVAHYIKKSFEKNAFYKFIGLLARPVLRYMKNHIDPERYNGASLLGLNGIVIKSHGSANELAFATAIDEAMSEVEHNVAERIHEHIANLLNEG